MRFLDDERAQSVQIGAVLLFATLIIAFSSYQAFVVPQQNEAIEFNHNQEVHKELQDLRNAIVSMPGGGSPTATTVTLGTTYPSRAVARNPGPVSGTLRTVGTDNQSVNLSVRNATATGETGDVWDGTTRRYNTGAIAYDPAYNLYGQAPLTVYEQSVLYNEFRSGTIVMANQTFVDGRTLSLTTINGSFSRTATGATSVDVRPVSSSEETVLVNAVDDDSPVTINVTSRLPASRWRTILSDESNVVSVTERPAAVPGFRSIQIKLATGVAYRLQLTKVGVGSGATDEEADYLTDVDGEGASVSRGESHRITLSVRDRFDNPVSDVSVNASAGSGKGSFADASRSTDGDGTATFEYVTTGSTALGTHRLNFTTNDSAVLSTRPFDQSVPKNVSVNVTVTAASGGGGTSGVYTLSWKDPDQTSGNSGASLTSCTADSCTWDVGASSDDTLTLNSTLTPAFEGVQLDYGVSNSTVGTVSPGAATTGASGSATTDLTAQASGTVDVLASSSDGSDVITIAVENVNGQQSANQVSYVTESATDVNSNGHLRFDLENTGSDSVTITEVVAETSGNSAVEIFEPNGGSCDTCHEMVFRGSDDGHFESGETRADAYSLGTTAILDDPATLGSGTTTTVHMSYFRNNGGNRKDLTGTQVTITVTFGDGSSTQYTFTP